MMEIVLKDRTLPREPVLHMEIPPHSGMIILSLSFDPKEIYT
jgi:hypothetical protein